MTDQAPEKHKTFQQFSDAVRDSCEGHAKRKNYTTEGVDGPNQLLNVCATLGIHDAHCIGEIIYKAAEYLKAPPATRRLLLTKIAGWAYVLWKALPAE